MSKIVNAVSAGASIELIALNGGFALRVALGVSVCVPLDGNVTVTDQLLSNASGFANFASNVPPPLTATLTCPKLVVLMKRA